MKLGERALGLGVLLVAVTGCGTGASPVARTQPHPGHGAITVRLVKGASPATAGPHPAVPCWPATASATYVDDVIGPDTPNPTCLDLSDGQRIEITNGTDRFGQRGHRLTVRIPGFPVVTLAPEQSVSFDAPVSTYFARGGHTVAVSPAPGGPAVLVR